MYPSYFTAPNSCKASPGASCLKAGQPGEGGRVSRCCDRHLPESFCFQNFPTVVGDSVSGTSADTSLAFRKGRPTQETFSEVVTSLSRSKIILLCEGQTRPRLLRVSLGPRGLGAAHLSRTAVMGMATGTPWALDPGSVSAVQGFPQEDL